MADSKQPPLDPVLQRLATESLAHTNEARRQIADFAKIRGAVVPTPSPTGFEDFQEEIITGLHELAALQREAAKTREPSQPQIVVVGRRGHSSSPPSHRSRGRGITLAGIAAVITALGGGAWLKQCATDAMDAENAAARHRAAAPAHS